MFEMVIQQAHSQAFADWRTLQSCGRALLPILTQVTSSRWVSSLFSMDSDLEAFSHYPTHGSFAALPVQATALTNYVNQRFLSY